MISEEYEYESASQQGHNAAMHYVRNFGKKNPKTDVLDKIRAEIEELYGINEGLSFDPQISREDVLKIIDKCKEESEI